MKYDKKIAISKFKTLVSYLNFNYERIYLFGSCVKNEDTEDSDLDVLIVLPQKVETKIKRKIRTDLRIEFHNIFPEIPIDILIKDYDSFEREKYSVNSISNEVYMNGVEI